MQIRRWILLLLLAGMSCAPTHVIADITLLDGDKLTAASKNLTVSFRGADIIRVYNHITNDVHFNTTAKLSSLLDMGMLKGGTGNLRCTNWRPGRPNNDGIVNTAQTTFTDLTRTIWMNVLVDEATQDIVVTIWGESNKDGVSGLQWGIRGLDLTTGKLILPANGGAYIDKQSAPISQTLSYPSEWEAQMAIWQSKEGGFVLYTRDEDNRFKKLHMSRRGDYADVAIEMEAVAPWSKANGVPQAEWRLNAFRGDWRVPAAGYRNLMHFNRKPVEANGGRAWAKDVRTVVTVHGSKLDPAIPEALSKKLDAKKTLLYLPDWRKSGFDVNYPDYTPTESVRPFIDRAKDVGFHVMLHTDLPGVSPTNPEFDRLRRYQVKDARNGVPMGSDWDHTADDPRRFAYINPAAKAYRDLFVGRIGEIIDQLHPDAIHLDVSGRMWNDGNGPIEDKSYSQGSVALHRALLTTFPDLVLGGESVNELTSPYNWFAQRWNNSSLPPHPISAFLFGDHVTSYGYLGQPNPDQSPAGFLRCFERYEIQGVNPTPVISGVADLADDNPGMKRLLKLARIWQDRDLSPFWNGDWTTKLFGYSSSDGSAAWIEPAGAGVRFSVGNEVVYHRVKKANQVVTSLFAPGWPAFDEGALFGLNPAGEYWLEPAPRPADSLHITALSDGVVIRESQITPEFALFKLSSAERTTSDLTRLLPNATTGTLFENKDNPFGSGATAEVIQMAVGGEIRAAILENPPWQGRSGGETFIEYNLNVPSSGRTELRFDAGLSDTAFKSDGVTFRVEADRKELWREHIESHQWCHRSVDLSPYAGQAVLLRLITGPGPKHNAEWDHAGWSNPHLVVLTAPANASAKIVLPPGKSGTVELTAGKVSPMTNGSCDVAEIAPPTSLAVFLVPGLEVTVGQSLLDLKFNSAVATEGLARTGSVFGSGEIGPATCGGLHNERTINAHPPRDGQTIQSWVLKMPDREGTKLAFAAGIADGSRTTGIGFSIRVNGETAWSWNAKEAVWKVGEADLAKWRNKSIILQLVTDAQGGGGSDFARWADVVLK